LPNPLIAGDNFLLELTYAIPLCKVFKHLEWAGKLAAVSGSPVPSKNLLLELPIQFGHTDRGGIKGT
jgi:hypothetical protein